MEKHEISKIVESAKQIFGRQELAKHLGINPNQINNCILGQSALPFTAALKLAEILDADPVTITCANAALKETDPEKKNYLESKILPLEISRIIYEMLTSRISEQYTHDFVNVSTNKNKTSKNAWQGAAYRYDLTPSDPRNWPVYRRRALERSSAWALRPIPSFEDLAKPVEEKRTATNWK